MPRFLMGFIDFVSSLVTRHHIMVGKGRKISVTRLSRGLMDRALDLKPEVTQGCGFESRLRQEVHDCSPGAAMSAAHCSKCVHLDGLNAENTFHSSLYSV